MKNNKSAKQIRKDCWAFCGKNIGNIALLLIPFLIIAAICCSLSFLSPLSLILTVPLLLIPFIFAMQIINDAMEKEPISNSLIWSNFKNYFASYFGVYRLLISFLKALACYLVVYFVAAIVFSSIASRNWPEFTESINKLIEMFSDMSVNMNTILEFVATDIPTKTMLCSCLIPSTFFFLYCFGHCVGVNFINSFLRNSAKPEARRQSDALFARCIKAHRKEIYKDYYGVNFPVVIAAIIGLGLGIGIYFLTGLDYTYIFSFMLSGFLLFISFFLPYMFKGIEIIFNKHSYTFSAFSIEQAEIAVTEMLNHGMISEEDASKAKEEIEAAKKLLEEKKEKEGEGKDSLEK